MTPRPGIDAARLSPWLSRALPGGVSDFEFRLIAAGGSNLTFEVTDAAGGRWALRRPPAGRALPTAHDMGREWRILEALAPVDSVPTPTPIAFCDDPEVLGAPFYVMSFATGRILRDSQDGRRMSDPEAAVAKQSLVDVQAALHSLDFVDAGLGDLGRHTDYVPRQLKRWRRQVHTADIRELPLHEELHARLAASLPAASRPPALVHGDFRFDNCVLADDGRVSAVLDWELATIGDPLADFAWSLCYWADPDDDLTFLRDSPTLAPNFGRRNTYRQLYERATGFDTSDLGYLEVFSWWKQASIVEGVYARRVAGSSGGMAPEGNPEALARRVDDMLQHAAALAEGVL